MSPLVSYATPMLRVREMERSIRFYQMLGFRVVDTEGSPVGWARMHCEGSALMLLQTDERIEPCAQSITLTMYTPDLPGLREHLFREGVKTPRIVYPKYMPSGETSLQDPDAYMINICQWGAAEQREWERRIAARA